MLKTRFAALFMSLRLYLFDRGDSFGEADEEPGDQEGERERRRELLSELLCEREPELDRLSTSGVLVKTDCCWDACVTCCCAATKLLTLSVAVWEVLAAATAWRCKVQQ